MLIPLRLLRRGFRRKLEYDLYYAKNMSILLDVRIILKTIGVVLFPKGAR